MAQIGFPSVLVAQILLWQAEALLQAPFVIMESAVLGMLTLIPTEELHAQVTQGGVPLRLLLLFAPVEPLNLSLLRILPTQWVEKALYALEIKKSNRQWDIATRLG
jgi:hypothetical protein